MKKKILAALCVISMVLINCSMIFSINVSAEDALVDIGPVLSNKTGNIFEATDTLSFGQTFKNNTENQIAIRCTTEILDEGGAQVWTRTWPDAYLAGGAQKTFTFTLESPGKYGVFTLKLTELALIDGNTYRRVYEKKFSICKTLNTSNLNPQFGYNQAMVRTGVADPAVATQLMLKSGAKWHREGIEWPEIEQSEGVYSISASAKTRLQGVKNSGLETVCILKGANPIYTGYYTDPRTGEKKAKAPSTDEEIAAFANYCRYVATELGGLVEYFEIWNEWNVKNFNPSQETPETYAKVLKAAYNAIKSVNPDYKVLGCAISGFDTTWIGRVLTANGGTPYMDILSLHDYEFSLADGFTEQQFITNVGTIKSLLARYSLDLPLWLTEAGFSTYDNSTEGFVPGCTESEQRNSMVMLNAVNKAYGLFDKVIQYCLYDGNDATHIESNWGVLNSWTDEGLTGTAKTNFVANAAKPAYPALAAMNYFIGGNTEFINKTVNAGAREYAFEFYNNNMKKPVTLLINGGLSNSGARSVDLGCTEVELYDKYGNFIEKKTSDTGEYNITVSTEPLYAVAAAGTKIRVDAHIDYNTGIATVSGATETPFDLVSLMLVTDGEPITTYDASRIEYLDQATSDGDGAFSFEFAPEDPAGDYQIYVNSKSRRNKNIQDVVFTYSAAGIKLFKNNTEVTNLTQLSAGDTVNVKVGGTAVTGADIPKIIVTQYKDGKIVDVSAVSAAGDASTAGNEIVKPFTVASGIDKIKVMYWKMGSLESIVESFEIQ